MESEFTFVGTKAFEGRDLELWFSYPNVKSREGSYRVYLGTDYREQPPLLRLFLEYTTSDHSREFPFPKTGHPAWKHLRNLARMRYDPRMTGTKEFHVRYYWPSGARVR